jgi:probable F420-dependent oxidoreductase
MRFGIHLAQFGRALTPESVQRSAMRAEELGYDDVWVSDHLVVPASQPYPAPLLADPLVSLSFAAAVTDTIGLGTSVLVGPQYASPLQLANTLATIDHCSNGRLTVGIGIGWSELEYKALGAPFDHRGDRLDEIIDLLRDAWGDDPATHEGTYYPFEDMHVLPKPVGSVPIWVGGGSEAAFRRAAERGNGYHGIGVPPEAAAEMVAKVRGLRPDEDFTVSLRVDWDARNNSAEEIAEQRGVYEEAGVQHIVVAPTRGSIDAWLEGMETIAGALQLTPR